MKKYEKGSLMIEILAVLALISLITPMLFKQVSRRNDEVTRINIATEMRAIKDAMSAYIQTYEEKIAGKLGLQDNSGNYTSGAGPKLEKLGAGEVGDLVEGFLMGSSAKEYLHPKDGDYYLYFYGYNVPVYVDASGSAQQPISGDMYRPVIMGVVVQQEKAVADRLSTASRIASLIGSEGGVAEENGKITGIGEAWSLEVSDVKKYAVAAVTAFDADSNSKLLDNLKIKDFHGETASATQMAAERFHALQFLSVGPKDMDKNTCLKGYGETSMTVSGRGEIPDGGSEECEPLFEVNGSTGEVFIKGAILTNEEVPEKLKEAAKDKNGNSISCSDTDPCPAGLVCENSVCVYSHYSLDPAYTSVMNDIKVMSRGGARLSEILPNYISKKIQVVKPGDSGSGVVTAPKCPNGYVQAITVQPATIDIGKPYKDIVEISDGQGGSAHVGVVDGTEPSRFVIEIKPDNGEKTLEGFNRNKKDEPVENWYVSSYLENEKGITASGGTYLVAHTYCVFNWKDEDLPEKTRTKRYNN